MKYLCFSFSLLIIFTACEQVVNVSIEKEPGTIIGHLFPTGIEAFVEVSTTDDIRHVEVEPDGYFAIKKLKPGHYNLLFDAPEYGKRKMENVYIGDDEVNNIGEVELDRIPYPISQISIYDGQTDISVSYFSIDFCKAMQTDKVEKGIHFKPEMIDFQVSSYRNTDFRISFELIKDTEYTVTLDTTIRTQSGVPLEFPYSFSFISEPFRLEYFGPQIRRGRYSSYVDYDPLEFIFNSAVASDGLMANITISPHINVYIPTSTSKYLYLYSTQGWMSDTTIVIDLDQSLRDIDGNYLGSDTTLVVTIPPLKVDDVNPYDKQLVPANLNCIYIKFNNIIDEKRISEAIHFTPDFEYHINTRIMEGNSILRFSPDSTLHSDTEYKIEIETYLTDRHGVQLAEKWISTFMTQ